MKRERPSARRRLATLARLAVGALALPAGCSSPETAAIIELQSELGEALTRVEIEIRDGEDRTSGDTFTFDSERMPEHRAPFSFRVLPPTGEERASFVVRATAYAGGDFLAETKRRVQFEPGETIHRVLRLWQACTQLRCDDGTTCDPERVECAPVLDATKPSQRVSGMARSREGAADGGPREGGAQPDPNARDAEPEAGADRPGPTDSAGTDAAGATAQNAGAGGEAGSAGRGGAPDGGAGRGGSTAGDGGAAGSAGADADGGAGASAGQGGADAPDSGPSGVLRARDDWASVMNAGRNYIIRNNVYNQDASQVVSYQGTAFTIESVTGSASTGISSPDIHIGSIYGLATLDSNLPKRVGEVGGIYVGASHNAGAAISGIYNTHHGVWLSRGAGPDPSLPTGGALELWLYATPDRVPPGERIESAATVAGSSGQWDVWLGSFGDGPCVTYLRTEALSSFAGNLDAFLTDAVARGAIADSWSVTSVYTGFELNEGGAGLRVTDVTMAVE